MRLLFVIKSIALGGGGAERVLADVSSALAARGHEVVVASFDRAGAAPFYRYAGVRLVSLGIGDVASHTTAREIGGRISKTRSLVKELKPDVVIAFMHSSFVPAGLALLGTGIPLIASEHISYQHYSNRRLERAAVRLAPRLSAAITVQSESVRTGFPPALRKGMEVVPNPVNFEPAESPLVKASDRKAILAVGRLEDQKDQRTLIDAFARIAGRFPDWDLRIVGEGSLRRPLEEAVVKHGLEGRVHLPGLIGDIRREYAAADIFVMPSTYESFGIATAEALASGIPAVGFADCAGTNELIRDGINGLLVKGSDRARTLADGLARLMADESLRSRLGEAGPDSVAAYSLDSVVDAWERLLQRVLRRTS